MSDSHVDALVFFGATGDLAYKKIFPALYAMVPAGKALGTEFGMAEEYPMASVGFGLVAEPAGVDAAASIAEMRGILENYAAKGVPEDLVDAAKRSEVAAAEFQRNSIPGLANVWSNALAAEGRTSPDEDVEALKKVTVADVDPRNSPRGKRILESMRKICLALPDTSEGLQFGQSVWRAGKKVFAQAYCYEERWQVGFWVGVHAQLLMTDDPRYTIPPYMGHNGWIALDVSKKHSERELQSLALESYRHFALKRMLAKLAS